MNRQKMMEPSETRRTPRWWRALGVIIVALVFGVVMRATLLLAAPVSAPPSAAVAQSEPDHGGGGEHDDDYITKYGTVVTRPDGKVGSWVISDTELLTTTTYTATEATEVEGEPAVGSCVEVKSLESDPSTALKIRVKDAEHCGNDDDDDFVVTYGRVITAPDGIIGTWVISNSVLISFTVNESTEIEGSPAQGSCVEVKAYESDPSTAIKLREKDDWKCGDDDDHDKTQSIYGILESRPEGRIGTWVVDGVAYEANARTEFDFDHGRLVPGTCVKVKVLVSSPLVAKEIESERDYKCNGDDDGDSKGSLYGLIESLPEDLQNGIWVIGGFTFVVSPTTELIDNGKVFTTGATVKVDFTTDISNTNFATRIEIKFTNDNPCRGDRDSHAANEPNHFGGGHDHRYGFCPGRDGKAIGRIDSLPAGTIIGDWVIGGVPYQTNAYTKFKPQGDVFLVGERVRVEYVVLDDQTRLATKIKEIGGGGNPNGSFYAGYVDAKPEKFVGTWTIGGEPFEAISTTVFIERGTLFAVGSYVVVEYEITNDERVISKILTYVPPGAGDLNSVGRLQSMGGVLAAGVDTPLQTNEEWVVDGVTYIVSEATMLVEGSGDLAEGDVVSVNSYMFEGQRYATMIRAQSGKAFIPFAVNE